MPKIAKENIDALKVALTAVSSAVGSALEKFNAETASDAWRTCKSYTNKYEGRIMKLKRSKPKVAKKKSTTK